MQQSTPITLKPIGIIRSPYTNSAPYQAIESDDAEFKIILEPEYVDGLLKLGTFNYIYLIYYAHQIDREVDMNVSPPWAGGETVGVFASRSPVRPNPIGLSIVRIKKIAGNTIYTSGLDVFDGTPLLDIKPYIQDLDNKDSANKGWIDEIPGQEHLTLHIKGIPHDY